MARAEKALKPMAVFPLQTGAHSLAWLERPADNREVKSPNLFGPTIFLLNLEPQDVDLFVPS